jgi:hypothetical protein
VSPIGLICEVIASLADLKTSRMLVGGGGGGMGIILYAFALDTMRKNEGDGAELFVFAQSVTFETR